MPDTNAADAAAGLNPEQVSHRLGGTASRKYLTLDKSRRQSEIINQDALEQPAKVGRGAGRAVIGAARTVLVD
jgi:hypothetical protein